MDVRMYGNACFIEVGLCMCQEPKVVSLSEAERTRLRHSHYIRIKNDVLDGGLCVDAPS